eukprot:g7787.t1
MKKAAVAAKRDVDSSGAGEDQEQVQVAAAGGVEAVRRDEVSEDDDGADRAQAGHCGADENTEPARNEEAQGHFASLDPVAKYLDALKRENWDEICDALSQMSAPQQWEVHFTETQKMRFPCSWTRNSIYMSTAEEEVRAREKGLGTCDELLGGAGVLGGGDAAAGVVAKEKAGDASSDGEGEPEDDAVPAFEADDPEDEVAKLDEAIAAKRKGAAAMANVDTTKQRPFFNIGLQSCRPLGKCARAMRVADGRKLTLMCNAMMKVVKDRAAMTVTKDSWWLFAWGKGFVGGQTLVIAEPEDVDEAGIGGVEWYPVPRGARLVPESLQKRAMAYANRETDLKPFKFMRMSDRKILVCDAEFVEEDTDSTLLDIALPMKRLTSLHVLADFDGKLPHATSPVFPASWAADPSLRPEAIRNVKNLEWAASPEEAQALMNASNNRPADKEVIRYVCVFYPHKCALPSRAVPQSMKVAQTLGFETLGPEFDEARAKRDDFRKRRNKHGVLAKKVLIGGKEIAYLGGKDFLRTDKQKLEAERVCERSKKLLGARYVAPKNFVNNHQEVAVWHMFDNMFRDEGFALAVRKLQLLHGNVTKTTANLEALAPKVDEEGGGAGNNSDPAVEEVEKNSTGPGKVGSKVGVAGAAKDDAEESKMNVRRDNDAEGDEDSASGAEDDDDDDSGGSDGDISEQEGAGSKKKPMKKKKDRSFKSETQQARRQFRGIARPLEGRTLSWEGGTPLEGCGPLGKFPYRDHPANWWWMKIVEPKNVQPVLDLMEIVFGRIDMDHYQELRGGDGEAGREVGGEQVHKNKSGLSHDEALLQCRWMKPPCKVTISTKALEMTITKNVDENHKPVKVGKNDKLRKGVVKLSARSTAEPTKRPELYCKTFWGGWEKKRNPEFEPVDTMSELEEQAATKRAKEEMKQRKQEADLAAGKVVAEPKAKAKAKPKAAKKEPKAKAASKKEPKAKAKVKPLPFANAANKRPADEKKDDENDKDGGDGDGLDAAGGPEAKKQKTSK